MNTNPCYDSKTKTDCPRRSADCARTCKEWAKHVKERDAQYQRNVDSYREKQYFIDRYHRLKK